MLRVQHPRSELSLSPELKTVPKPYNPRTLEPAALQGNWNKESMIRKMLRETPRAAAEWIWWVDIDTLMPDMAVLPRFEAYEGADLVVWGNEAKILEGDMNGGAPRGSVAGF